MEANGGLITREDLENYQPIWREPLCGLVLALRICSMPPPSSGGVHIWQILNIITPAIAELQWHSADWIHLMAEAMKSAYSDGSQYQGDPNLITIPASELISAPYANFRRQHPLSFELIIVNYQLSIINCH